MKKLAIITTHPIQYNAPFFKMLNERGKVYPKVFYTWPQAIDGFDDPDFGKKVEWDIPLLDGYNWEAIENIAKRPSSKTWKGIDCPSLNQKIEDFDPNVVFVYGWNHKSHFKAMRYFKGKIPVWFAGDSTLLDEMVGWKRAIRRLGLNFVYQYVDKAFYVGTNNKEYFQAHGLKEPQLVFFPHAIDNERFKNYSKKQYAAKVKNWKKELGYRDKDIIILFAGKFEPRKNLQILVEAMNRIHKKINVHIKLLMVGNGPEYRNLTKISNGNPGIKFMPFQNQSEMPILYRLADIFCLPSKSETWGLAVNEAMACGRPVLASNLVGSARDLIDSRKNGVIFNANQVHDLEKKIIELNQLDLARLGENAREKISGWSYKVKCKAIEQNLYSSNK